MKIQYAMIFAVAVFMTACGGTSPEEQQVQQEKEQMATRIDSLENILFGQEVNVDREVAAQLLQSYIKFTDIYPADERSADYLYKGAGIARGVGVHSRALKMYHKILSDYPEFKKQAETYFLIAFTYDNDLKEIELAKSAYQEVIQKFPEHEFAEQSKERLKTIDLSDEELIELFMQRNAEAEAQVN